jgi:hypothetical protein
MSSTANMTRCRPSVLGGGFSARRRTLLSVVLGQLQLAVAVGVHIIAISLGRRRVRRCGPPGALDLPLAFQLHAELGEECDGGVGRRLTMANVVIR